MKIALVDDDQKELDCLFAFLSKLIGERNDIKQFHSAEEFLGVWKQGVFDLIILDIFMGTFTGMDVARELRKTDQEVRIVFGTSSNTFASESYEVNACFYLLKPFREERIKVMLDRLKLDELDKNRTVTLPDGQSLVLRNIVYAEYGGHSITIHNKRGGSVTARVLLSDVEALLSEYPYFCSPMKGIIINFYEASAKKNDIFIMTDGTQIPITRRKAKQVTDAYAAFRFEQLRKEGER